MPDLLSFLPLNTRAIDQIRQDMNADANAGGDPESESYIDTTEGGWFWDVTQACGIEMARLWDFASTDVPAVAFPAFAYGEYLDDHGEALGLTRKDATQAGGLANFTGTDGTLIPAGTEVGTIAPTNDDAVVFTTDVDVTVASGTAAVDITAIDVGAQGNVPAGNVSQLITPVNGVSTVTNIAPMSGGSDVESDEMYRTRILLLLSTPQGAGTIGDYERWGLAYPGVGHVSVTPVWDGPGTVHVVVTDDFQQPTSNVVTYGLQDQLDPPALLTVTTADVTLPAATIAASTTGFANSGTIRVASANVAYTGKTSGAFTGCSGGTGTHVTGTRVGQDFGKGRGLAPIGAVVTVDTVDIVTVAAAATVLHASGYSLDGTAGTTATRTEITNVVNDYLNSLAPGQTVYLAHVVAQFFKVHGVLNVTGLTLNGSAADVAIGALQVAEPGTHTFS